MTEQQAERENLALRAEIVELKKALVSSEAAWRDRVEELKARLAEAEKDLANHKLLLAYKVADDEGGVSLAALYADERNEYRARAEAAERKCAELSEALRQIAYSMRQAQKLGNDHKREVERSKLLAEAALASQPAPGKTVHRWNEDGECINAGCSALDCHANEPCPKPEMSAEALTDADKRALYCAEFHGGPCVCGTNGIPMREYLAALVRRLHKLTTPEAKP
jgi:hypothetical protein